MLVIFIPTLKRQKIQTGAWIGLRNQQESRQLLDLIMLEGFPTIYPIQTAPLFQESMELVRSFLMCLLFVEQTFLTKQTAGDKISAVLSGTMEPGLFCFVISGNSIVPLGPPAFIYPLNSQLFSAVTIQSVRVEATGLLNSRDYDVLVNRRLYAVRGLPSVTSSPQGSVSFNFDLSMMGDGTIIVELYMFIASTDAYVSIIQVPIIKDTVPPFVSITMPNEDAVIAATTMSVYGTAEVGSTGSLTFSDTNGQTSNVVISSILVDEAGNWEAENINIGSQSDGSITVSATFTDAAGNPAASTVRVVKDSVAAVSITSPSSESYVNSITASRVGVAGRGDALAAVTVTARDSRGSTVIASTTVAENQSWRLNNNLDLGSLADGVVTLVASIVDPVGNEAVSLSVAIIKDSTTFVAITSPAEFTLINQYNNYNLRIRGTGEAGGSVIVKIEDSSVSTALIQTAAVQVSEQGGWEIAPVDVSSQAEGSIRVSATITDAAGNRFTSNSITLNKDTIVTVVIASPSNQQYVVSAARGSLSISGYGDVGTNVFVTVSDPTTDTRNVVSSTVRVSPLGTWSVVVNVSTLADGILTLIAAATDAAGNIGNSNT